MTASVVPPGRSTIDVTGRTAPTIVMKHGAGGRAMRRLIEEVLIPGFRDMPVDGIGLAAMDDGAALRIGDQWLIVTTDSHVVQPIEFPGGDIGRLAVSGTVNDLAMMGATEPLGLTCALIVEEGVPYSLVESVHTSMLAACLEAGTTIVTGDTKVMGRGEIDGIVINTTGVGLTKTVIRDAGLQPGDRIIVTGTIGDHGMAIMALRHELGLDVELVSDVAPLNRMIRDALAAVPGAVTAMKDPTRGGLSSALHEMAQKSGVGVVLHESLIPLNPVVRAAADMLGLDPLHVANEGKAVLGVRGDDSVVDAVLAALRRHETGVRAAVIGECTTQRPGDLILDTGIGRRLVAESDGEPLPRIC